MTVKELKEKLDQFPENCVVLIPDTRWIPSKNWLPYTRATSITIGINELDGCVIIDDYEEDKD